jgi:hypothetical protein
MRIALPLLRRISHQATNIEPQSRRSPETAMASNSVRDTTVAAAQVQL